MGGICAGGCRFRAEDGLGQVLVGLWCRCGEFAWAGAGEGSRVGGCEGVAGAQGKGVVGGFSRPVLQKRKKKKTKKKKQMVFLLRLFV